MGMNYYIKPKQGFDNINKINDDAIIEELQKLL